MSANATTDTDQKVVADQLTEAVKRAAMRDLLVPGSVSQRIAARILIAAEEYSRTRPGSEQLPDEMRDLPELATQILYDNRDIATQLDLHDLPEFQVKSAVASGVIEALARNGRLVLLTHYSTLDPSERPANPDQTAMRASNAALDLYQRYVLLRGPISLKYLARPEVTRTDDTTTQSRTLTNSFLTNNGPDLRTSAHVQRTAFRAMNCLLELADQTSIEHQALWRRRASEFIEEIAKQTIDRLPNAPRDSREPAEIRDGVLAALDDFAREHLTDKQKDAFDTGLANTDLHVALDRAIDTTLRLSAAQEQLQIFDGPAF